MQHLTFDLKVDLKGQSSDARSSANLFDNVPLYSFGQLWWLNWNVFEAVCDILRFDLDFNLDYIIYNLQYLEK